MGGGRVGTGAVGAKEDGGAGTGAWEMAGRAGKKRKERKAEHQLPPVFIHSSIETVAVFYFQL